ncbi:MAG TPA: hypothetical protein VN017_01665 [Pseudoxanthomonas sp.]|nr:hypothetical protein [Pseudoxanthomonas sp.]
MSGVKKLALPMVLCFFGALLLFGFGPWLKQDYVSSAPRTPNPATGQVIEYNQHGYIVFFSRRQELTLSSVSLLGTLLILAGGIFLSGHGWMRGRQWR